MASAKRPKLKTPAERSTRVAPSTLKKRPRATAQPASLESALRLLSDEAATGGQASLLRFGIVTKQKVLGVPMATIQRIGKRLGKSQELASALWDSDCYEARLLTAYVTEPSTLSAAQMDRWCNDFDNWAVCDTLCFHLFDRTPHAYARVEAWSKKQGEFQKRAAFALLASLAGHDKTSGDAPFLNGLKLSEAAASDERNFVKKAIVWALRRIGGRNRKLHEATLALCERLIGSDSPTARATGKEVKRELNKPIVQRQLSKTR
jgi:3-methyladenine DNA glycosylase AlkD